MLKSEIRTLMLKKRKSYTNLEKNSKLICERLFHHFNFNKINIVHLFLPIKEKKEIDTFLIINELKSKYNKCEIVVPVMNFNSKTLLHKYYSDTLYKNRYGILEPLDSKIFTNNNAIDIILVPLLAFDLNGNRVGYGGGYYDRFLKDCNNSIKVGLSLEDPISLIKDINEYDIKLDYCITKDTIYTFSSNDITIS